MLSTEFVVESDSGELHEWTPMRVVGGIEDKSCSATKRLHPSKTLPFQPKFECLSDSLHTLINDNKLYEFRPFERKDYKLPSASLKGSYKCPYTSQIPHSKQIYEQPPCGICDALLPD